MRVQVAVGILVKANQSLLIQQRRSGTDCAGLWEFPGGKLEAGESPEAALKRELKEELDIKVIDAYLLSTLEYDYTHACVSLHTYLVHQWSGELKGAEGQEIAWGSPEKLIKYDLLEATYPLLTQATAHLTKV
jgi:8-oxo-dGTP diphosphatase